LSRRVVLVVPDAGPLISLGRADRLDLLLLLGLPVWIVDQVLHEAAGDPRFADAGRVAGFVRDHPETVHIFATAVGGMAAAQRAAGPRRQPGLGEAAIAEFLARLEEVAAPDDPVLLLYEDGDIRQARFILPPNVHLVSTRALLLGLERRGRIASAEAVWQEILAGGRAPARDAVDQPGRTPEGGESDW
jgi:hypothetical protein